MGLITGLGKLVYYTACIATGAVLTYNCLREEPNNSSEQSALETTLRDGTDLFARANAWVLETTTSPMLNQRDSQCNTLNEDYVLGRCNQLMTEYLECPRSNTEE